MILTRSIQMRWKVLAEWPIGSAFPGPPRPQCWAGLDRGLGSWCTSPAQLWCSCPFPLQEACGGQDRWRRQGPAPTPAALRNQKEVGFTWATSQGKSLDLPFISISFFTKERARISPGAPICTELLCWCPLLLTHSPLPAAWGCWPPSPGAVAVPPRGLAPRAVLLVAVFSTYCIHQIAPIHFLLPETCYHLSPLVLSTLLPCS